jgi:hypothetical protein
MYNTWHTENLFVAYNVEIASGAFKIRANNEWNDDKNYGLEVAGNIYADKYYSVIKGSGSQNATPMAYGTYDVYFDLANKRVALMTPGKAYAEAVDGGEPIAVVAGLKDHAWGVAGLFQDWKAENAVEAVVEGDWAVAKNVTLAANDEFKFVADNAWTLSYGAACDVNVGTTYTTYNNGGNMKFVGEAGAYNLYFSLVDATFYMEKYNGEPVEYTLLFGTDYNSKKISSYTDSWSVTNDGFTCLMNNWNNNNNGWNYVKAGRKNNASVATIVTDAPISEAISTVTMTVDAVTAAKINSLKLYVSSSEDFADAQVYNATPAVGDVEFDVTTPASESYYKIEVDCASGSSNGLITVSKVVFAN